MPFERETLPALVDQSRNDIESRLSGADTRVRPNNLDINAAVWGGGLDGVYDAIAEIARRMFPQNCTKPGDDPYLEAHAARQNVPRKLAEAASGFGTIAGPNGVAFPMGKLLQRQDGAQFVTSADVAVGGGFATVPIVATVAGIAGNTSAGTVLRVVTPEDGFASTVTVTGDDGLDGGLDKETLAELLARLEQVWQEQPQGGATWDYVEWALDVPGVTRAWVFPKWMGVGTVGVSFVMDDQAGSILPDDDSVALVQAYLDDPHRAPPIGDTFVFAPTFANCAFTIQCPNIPAVRASIQAALDALFLQDQSVGGAYLLPDGTEPAGVIKLARMWSTIEAAAGDTDVLLTSPTTDFIAASGQLPSRGTITWVLPP